MALTQDGRLLSITTPLGKDVLLLETLEGSEELSGLFRLNLVLLSEKSSIGFADLVGQRVTINIQLPNNQTRYINGFVSRFSQGGFSDGLAHYYAEVVPWLWFLTRTVDCRVFQKKNVPDIIKQIFTDLGFQDYKFQLQGSFEPREFCLQYRESDFSFISRLMEEEGIFYFFEHTQSKHTMVIGNDPGVHQPCPNAAKVKYRTAAGGVQEEETVFHWHVQQELNPGKYTLNDYYFPTPSTSLKVTAPTAISVGGNSKFEMYDYPGYYAKRFDGDDKASKVRPDGERTVKLRMQAEEAQHKVATGASNCRALVPGYKTELTQHYRSDLNGPYTITGVTHSANNNIASDRPANYSNSFNCIPQAVPFRPSRATPKPVMRGCQTAVVVGISGEEIDTDKYGRVKVQFHWDREGKKDQNSSCWVRVATPWAGKNWGMIHIPRIGQEVIVDFLEGDPDQPIIIGSVYNAEMMPPYKLPDNKTQSGIKTRSTLKGGDENFNEICFEDKKGSEFIYVRAEKDLTQAVENDETHWVGHDRWAEVDNDETTIIKKNRTETIEEGDEKLNIKKGNREVKIDTGNDTLKIAKGNLSIKADAGKIEIEAGQEINLKAGQSSIVLKKDGTITIEGLKITIKGLKIEAKADAQIQLKAAMAQVNGDGMLTLKGGVTMVN